MPGDQRGDDALSACFDSAPLGDDHDISGAPQVTLRLASNQPQAQIAVRLNHVHPDGASTRVTYGVLNLSHRGGSASPQPMVAGEETEITLDLDHIAYRVPRGHRLRVAVSNAYWPLVWPAPRAGTLHLSGGSIDLPLAPTDRDEWTFPLPEAAAPWETETLREAAHVRRRETDMATGTVSLVIEDDFGKLRDLDHGMISDDPSSAHGACHWTDEREREGLRLRTEARCEMWSDAEKFYLHATLEAYENDSMIFDKEICEEIPRVNL
jgi:hypothetical protein